MCKFSCFYPLCHEHFTSSLDYRPCFICMYFYVNSNLGKALALLHRPRYSWCLYIAVCRHACVSAWVCVGMRVCVSLCMCRHPQLSFHKVTAHFSLLIRFFVSCSWKTKTAFVNKGYDAKEGCKVCISFKEFDVALLTIKGKAVYFYFE